MPATCWPPRISCIAPAPPAATRPPCCKRLARRSSSARPPFPRMLPRLARVLSAAHMGTQFYLAGTEGLIGQAERDIMQHRLSARGDPEGASRIDPAPRAMRALQGHHRKRRHRPVPMQPLRAEPVRARPLLAPHRRLSGRQHRRRRPRRCSRSRGEVQMSGGAKLNVRVAEVGQGQRPDHPLSLCHPRRSAAAGLFRRRAYRGGNGRSRHPPPEPLFADVRPRRHLGL